MAEIRFSTSADLKGFHDLEAALDKLHAHVKEVGASMQKIGFGAMPQVQNGQMAVGGGSDPPTGPRSSAGGAQNAGWSGVAQGPGPRGQGGHKPQYNLNTQGGVIEYYDNVLAQALPMLNAMRPSSGSGPSPGRSRSQAAQSPQNVPGMVPVLGGHLRSRAYPGSSQWYGDWLARANQPDIRSMVGSSVAEELAGAYSSYQQGETGAGRTAYQRLSSEANQPPVTGQRTSFLGHFARSAKGNSIGSVLGSGLRGAARGTLTDMAVGGSPGLLGGGAAGMMADGGLAAVGAAAVPAAAVLLATKTIADGFASGYATWQQTAPTSSQLAHSLGTVGQGANILNLSIQKAAAAFGVTATTALQSAQAMAQAFGGNNASVANLTGQAAQFAMANGLSDQQQTQLMTTLGTLGVTSGKGSTLTPYAGNRMLTQLAQVSHMQGRQGPLFTGLASVYGTLASINPVISNPTGVAGQYAAMNASGIQGLQGMRGAQLVSQMDQGFANAKGIQQLLGFSAIMKASGGKITNPFQMMSILEQGTAALIPGTKTTYGAAYLNMVKKISPNKYLQAALMPGLDINQGMAVIKSGALNAPALKVPSAPLAIPLTQADKHAIAAAQKAAQAAKLGQTGAIVTTFIDQLEGGVLKGFTGIAPFFSHLPKTISSFVGGQASLINTALNAGHAGAGSMLPYAVKVSKATGIPAADLIAQWAHESTWGTSHAALVDHNLGGLHTFGAYQKTGPYGKHASFSSLAQFAQADTQVLLERLPNGKLRYGHALDLARHGASAKSIFSALASEGYTGSPTPAQASAYGSDVQAIVNELVSGVKKAIDASLTNHRQAQKQDRIAQAAHAQSATRGPYR